MIYRKLPGRRRGLIHGASVWLAPDHLLSVRSHRIREYYKRYYLRDVQAVVVADAPRFHVSTRLIAIAVLWAIAYLVSRARADIAATALWIAGGGLVLGWFLVSLLGSCRCRIYTAVSSDELPSIYRRWTARKFLEQVTPRIAEVQGVMEGNWAEAVELRIADGGEAKRATSAGRAGATRSWATDLLTGALLATALTGAVSLSRSSRPVQFALYACNGLEIAGAVAVVVQHYRGKLRPAMQRLAVAALIAMGCLFYARPLAAGIAAGASGKPTAIEVDVNGMPKAPIIVRQLEVAASTALGLIGLAIVLTAEDDRA